MIVPLPALKDNYIWVVYDTKAKVALVVDPGEAAPVLTFLKQHSLRCVAILITHHHWDHSGGVDDLLQSYSVPVYGSQESPCQAISHRVQEGEQITPHPALPSYQVLTIPGHTLDHIAYYTEGCLFCGDTLFTAGCGRAFEGSPSQLYASLQKLTHLPDTTAIYCGHEYTLKNLDFAQKVEPSNPNLATRRQQVQTLRAEGKPTVPALLREEKETNPFLRCWSEEIRQSVGQHMGTILTDPVLVFGALREWKNNT